MRSVAYTGLLLALGCAGSNTDQAPDPHAEEPITGETVSKSVELGPVKATVSVVPAKPKVGDKVRLVLRVEAEADVDVEMPPGTEALGRFRIVNYKQDDGKLANGKRFYEQRLTMHPGGSGLQRVPRLRIEFVDNRKLAGLDAGVARAQELLTDEVVIDVQSVQIEGGVTASLRGARSELLPPSYSALGWLWPWLIALAVMVVVAVSMTYYLRYRATRSRVSAYDTAMNGFAELERRGLPAPNAADAWYVELSGVVRRYLEGRYALRAPELTTEEFLREARRSADISDAHRVMLSTFLEQCDQVKFAGYRPDAKESQQIFERARVFVQESRVKDDSETATLISRDRINADKAAA